MEWISVEDRLPDLSEESRIFILVSEEQERLSSWFPSYENRIYKGWWIPERRAFAYEDIENANHCVTHWMPLPDPPLEENPDI